MNVNQIIVIFLVIIMLWWPIGGLINRRRGQAWLDWFKVGVRELGASSTHKWLRSFQSVGQLTVNDLRAPFQSLDIIFTLEGRDNLIMWGLRHLRGRRDEMIIQANLQSIPKQDLEIGARGRRSYDAYLNSQKDNPFTQLPEQDGFRIAWRGTEDKILIARLRSFLAKEGKVIMRMSVQHELQTNQRVWSPRESKHLLLRVAMTQMDTQSPAAFFAALREWAGSIAVTEEESSG